MGDFVRLDISDRVAIMQLNRPETFNAIATHDDCDDIVNALQTLGNNPAVSCIILTGNG